MTVRRALPMVLIAACGGSLEGVDEAAVDDADVAAATSQVVAYSEDGWDELADAFQADKAAGAVFFMHIPALANDKTLPRGPAAPAAMRARGSHFRAMAEFHWGGWHQDTSRTWYEKGVEFRRRMAARGYDVSKGDTWAINELPSSFRSDPAVRQHARDAIRGLYDGPPGAQHVMGAVFLEGMGSSLQNFAEYKPNVESALTDSAFWTAINGKVRFWGQETYTDPRNACVGSAVPGAKSNAINDFIEHVPRLAEAGGSRAAAARSFLQKTYVPLINAAWKSPAYQTQSMSLDQMRHFVSNQVYAARAWSTTHDYPDRRIGLGWTWKRDAAGAADLSALAQRIASSVHHAYDDDGGAAAGACSPSRAYTWCQCAVANAHFNTGWQTFASW